MTESEKTLIALLGLYRKEPAGVVLDADEYPYDDVDPNCLLGVELRPEAADRIDTMNIIISELEKSSIRRSIVIRPKDIENVEPGPNEVIFMEIKTNLLQCSDSRVISNIADLMKLSDEVSITRLGRKRGVGIVFTIFNIWEKYRILSKDEDNLGC